MKLTGRRQSSNVDDRRGGGSMAKTGTSLGLGGLVVAAILTWMLGGDPMSVLQNVDLASVVQGNADGTTQSYTPNAQEQELAEFASTILASTEDIWGEEFRKMGKTYQAPKLVLFKGSVQSGCGGATASVGPFYCSADQCVYLDLSFLSEMRSTLGADGDFAYAYVIAHEVGHHVQNLLGVLNSAHSQMARSSETVSNQISVRIELQADFLAGCWACNENKTYKSLEDGDIEEGIQTAQVIGDNYLQEKARGYSQPESFTHGTSAQRIKWLKKGINSGKVSDGDTFSVSYSDL